ncbi:MAG: hypothetical protein ACKPKO_07530, partial [Candidatus Fonsibacter sp.]
MIKDAEDVDTVHNLVVEHGASKVSAMELKKSIKQVVDDLKYHVKRRASDITKKLQEGATKSQAKAASQTTPWVTPGRS